MFLDLTQLEKYIQTVLFLGTNDQLVAETATYTIQSKHKRWTSMPSAGFEKANPAIKRLQALDLDHMVILISNNNIRNG